MIERHFMCSKCQWKPKITSWASSPHAEMGNPAVTRTAEKRKGTGSSFESAPFCPRVFLVSAYRPEGWLVGAVGIEFHLPGYGVISNDADHFKRFFLFFLRTNTPFPRHGNRVSVTVLFFTCVTQPARAVSASSIRCCPPNISSVTIDHDELCELPVGRRVA